MQEWADTLLWEQWVCFFQFKDNDASYLGMAYVLFNHAAEFYLMVLFNLGVGKL